MKTAALVITFLVIGYVEGYLDGREKLEVETRYLTWVEHPLGGGCYQTPDGRIVVAEGKGRF